MVNNSTTRGSVQEFDDNWKDRKEALYNHWTKGNPKNQIQLAFRSHWTLFKELMEGKAYKTSLEVGCGRGTVSSYFADNGFDCTLLDLSQSILDTAKNIFENNGHNASFVNGDALKMPFEDNSFDVVVSIGLFEHFEDVETPVTEQLRILKPGGLFLGYIVPERPDNVQRYYRWVNRILSFLSKLSKKKAGEQARKTDIFRSDYGSERYLPVIEKLAVENVFVSGMYPLPMISHSPEFPFSLLPKPAEWMLTRIFESALWVRKKLYKKNPWLCEETFGQAFLVAFTKGAE